MLLVLISYGNTSPTYNITVTQITIGGTTADLEFNAIFDSGTSFTYLNDPAYTQITESVSGLSSVVSFTYLELQMSSQSSYNFGYLAVQFANKRRTIFKWF